MRTLQYFFAPENMKKTPLKVVYNWQRFFSRAGPAAQTAQKQKSRTTKSPLMQDWGRSYVFKICHLLRNPLRLKNLFYIPFGAV